jgi:hypothetical protein
MKYTYIPTGIKGELMRFGVSCKRGKLSGLLEEDWWHMTIMDEAISSLVG